MSPMKPWSRHDEEVFIKYIREHPSIWDRSHPDYNKRDLRAAQMRHVSHLLDDKFEATELAYKYQNWRSQLRREVARIKSSHTPPELHARWRLFDKLSFLVAETGSTVPGLTPVDTDTAQIVGLSKTQSFDTTKRSSEDTPPRLSPMPATELQPPRLHRKTIAHPTTLIQRGFNLTLTTSQADEIITSPFRAYHDRDNQNQHPPTIAPNEPRLFNTAEQEDESSDEVSSHSSGQATHIRVIKFCSAAKETPTSNLRRRDLPNDDINFCPGVTETPTSVITHNSEQNISHEPTRKEPRAWTTTRLDAFCEMLKQELEPLSPQVQEYIMLNTLATVITMKTWPSA